MSRTRGAIMKKMKWVVCLAVLFLFVLASVALAQTTEKNVMAEDGQMMIDSGKAMMENGARMIDNGNMLKQQHEEEYGEIVVNDGKEMMDLGDRIVRHGEKMMMEKAGQ